MYQAAPLCTPPPDERLQRQALRGEVKNTDLTDVNISDEDRPWNSLEPPTPSKNTLTAWRGCTATVTGTRTVAGETDYTVYIVSQ